jgi:hypothetical protein
VYAYALNNPLADVDPSGLTVITLPIVGGGSVLGGLTAGAAATAGAAGVVVVGGAVAIDLTIDLVIAMSHYSKVKRLLEQADKIDEWVQRQLGRLGKETNPDVRERIMRELKKGRDAARKLRDLAREIAEGC